MLENIIENLELTEPHQAFFILKNCLSIPKVINLLRSAPCFKCKVELEVFDTAIKTNMEKICNVSFGEENWSQVSLPIRHADLGLRSAADLSLPCFLSSSHACKGLVNRLLPYLNLEIPYGDVNDAIDDWSEHHDSSPLEKGIHAARDDLACRDTLNSLLNTNNGYLLHKKRVTLLPGQKRSQLSVLETCSVLMNSVLQSSSKLMPKSLKAQNAVAAKLLMSWSSMASPVLKMQAASQGIQPSIPSSRGH